jgi:hypothetical protein
MPNDRSALFSTRLPSSTRNEKGIVASYSEGEDRGSLFVVVGGGGGRERVGQEGGENVGGEGEEEAVCSVGASERVQRGKR